MPKKPPKRWWDKTLAKVTASLAKAHPDWKPATLQDRAEKTTGDIWFNKMTEGQRQKILKKTERRNPGNPGPDMTPAIILLIIVTALAVIIGLWLLLRREPEPPPDNGDDGEPKAGRIKLTIRARDPLLPIGSGQCDIAFYNAAGFLVTTYPAMWNTQASVHVWESNLIELVGVVSFCDGTVMEFNPAFGVSHEILVGPAPGPDPILPTRDVYGTVRNSEGEGIRNVGIRLRWQDIEGDKEMNVNTDDQGFYLGQVTTGADFEMRITRFQYIPQEHFFVWDTPNPIDFILLLQAEEEDWIVVNARFDYLPKILVVVFIASGQWNVVVYSSAEFQAHLAPLTFISEAQKIDALAQFIEQAQAAGVE